LANSRKSSLFLRFHCTLPCETALVPNTSKEIPMFNTTVIRNAILALVMASCIASNIANAAPDQQGGKRHGPPPEALAACSDHSEGDSCNFSGRRGNDVEGTCIVPRNEEGLACAPDGGPPQDHGNKSDHDD
jgi:hypothetical protein